MAKRLPGEPPKLARKAPAARRAFAIRLYEARKRLYDDAIDFAKFTGLPPRNYNRYESAESAVPLHHLATIARGLEESLDWLILGDESARRHKPPVKPVKIAAAE